MARLPRQPGPQNPQATLLTWLGSPGGTDRRVLLSTSPMRSSDTLQGGLGQCQEAHGPLMPHPTLRAPHSRAAEGDGDGLQGLLKLLLV